MDRLASSNSSADRESLKHLDDIDVLHIEKWDYTALYGRRFVTTLPSKSNPESVKYHLFFQDGPEYSNEELVASLSDKNSALGIPLTSFQPFGNLMCVKKIEANKRRKLFHLVLPWILVFVILLAFFLFIFLFLAPFN